MVEAGRNSLDLRVFEDLIWNTILLKIVVLQPCVRSFSAHVDGVLNVQEEGKRSATAHCLLVLALSEFVEELTSYLFGILLMFASLKVLRVAMPQLSF